MEPISPTDRLARLLRQKLSERAKTAGSATVAKAATGLEVSRAVALTGDGEDRQVRRALIEGILVDQFGDHLVNEAKFQQVVEEVAKVIEEDRQAAELLEQVLQQFRDG